jgi:hypothetical protein
LARVCCVASLLSHIPEGLCSSDRLDVAEANMYPIPAFPGASAPAFRPLPEGFGRSMTATSDPHPRVFSHRVSTAAPHRRAEARRSFLSVTPHKALCDRSHRHCGVALQNLARPKPGQVPKRRPRFFQPTSFPYRSMDAQRAFRTVGRLPRGPSRDAVITQDTQREVEAPSMRFVSFRRSELR